MCDGFGFWVGDFVEESGVGFESAVSAGTLYEDGVFGWVGVEFSCFADGESCDNAGFVAGEESAGFGIFEDDFFVCLDGFWFGEFVESAAFSKFEAVVFDELVDGAVCFSDVEGLEAGGVDSDESFAGVGHGLEAHVAVWFAGSGALVASDCCCEVGVDGAASRTGANFAVCESVDIGHDVPGGGFVAFSEGFFKFAESSGALVADGEDDVGDIIELE